MDPDGSYRGTIGRASPKRGSHLAVLAGLALGLLASCLLELDQQLACGDGYVDELAGEQCDPAEPTSFEEACCHPVRCTLIDATAGCRCGNGQIDVGEECEDEDLGGALCPNGVDPPQCNRCQLDYSTCNRCGDGRIDEGEECDGDNLNGAICPGGVGTLQCVDCHFDHSECESCGNGVVDEGEECEPDIEGLVDYKECTELLPVVVGKPYASGQTTRCKDDCRYNRAACSYCGNDTIDGQIRVDDDVDSIPEVCDGTKFNDAEIAQRVASPCYALEPAGGVRPVVACQDCVQFTDPDPNTADECCVIKGFPCPLSGSSLQCCIQHDDPTVETICQLANDGISLVCR